MKLLRAHLDDAVLREALDQAPPGIIDPRSWSYWNVRVGRYPCRCATSGDPREYRRLKKKLK